MSDTSYAYLRRSSPPPCWLEQGEEERRFMNRGNPAHAEEPGSWLTWSRGARGILIVSGTGSFRANLLS